MKLYNVSQFAFLNLERLNIPKFFVDTDGDHAYDCGIIPMRGFSRSDFTFSRNKYSLKPEAEFDLNFKDGFLTMDRTILPYSDDLVVVYSLPMINGAMFMTRFNMIAPTIYKFSSGDLDRGYFHELLIVVEPDTPYEIIQYSKELDVSNTLSIFWDKDKGMVSLIPGFE